jgi:hypothetical protein
MNTGPSVVVNKSGFLSSIAKGIFGTLIALIICGTVLGFAGLRMADKHAGKIIDGTCVVLPELIDAAAQWQDILPPVLADALNDRRAFEYREQVEIAKTIKRYDAKYGERAVVALEITNEGEEVVSLMMLRMVVEDEGPHSVVKVVNVATPLAVEDDWAGPLLPGQTRKVPVSIRDVDGELDVSIELTELRLWSGPAERSAEVKQLAAKTADEETPSEE